MHSLDEEFLRSQAISIEMSGSLRRLGQYQGKQELLIHRRPQLIKTLKDIAIIQSTESSNRIEGIVVPSKRLQEIIKENAQPKDRPEGQVLGYRNVLSKIHTAFDQMELSTDAILQMHRDLLEFTDLSSGSWKNKDNLIEEMLPNGQWVTRFVPVSASQTHHYMEELCRRFHRLWDKREIDQLLIILAFVFDFLCIHPFLDGNGRISRLLTVLLLHKIGIDVTRYISLERLIEETKESYYDVLHKCSEHWIDKQHRLTPWFDYHISLILNAYRKLEGMIEVAGGAKGEKTAWIIEMIEQLPKEFRIGDLIRLCPGVSRPMVRHVLKELRKEGTLMVIGLGRNAKWKKIKNI